MGVYRSTLAWVWVAVVWSLLLPAHGWGEGRAPGASAEAPAAMAAGDAQPLSELAEDAQVIPGAGYRIGVGDLLSVSVWRDESLTSQVVVLPDGTITLPLIGTVQAQGLGLADLEAEVTRRLTPFIPNPVLTVAVTRINSLMVYVIGKVNRPGRFELADHITVLQALALAGGTNTFARANRIKIFRETAEGTRIYDFDYDQVAKGRHLEQNIRLERGDVIVVP
jgi:polysaccharide biosynthesis/export protein